MAPTSSAEALTPLSPAEQDTLLETAKRALEHAVATGGRLVVDAAQHTEPLRAARGCFVTLRIGDMLRGCVGSLRARGPLVSEVARSAYMAGFEDTRFDTLTEAELGELHVHVSVLSEPVPLTASSEEDLLRQLRPGIDGLILRDGARMATFLPDVWESIPDKRMFVRQLKLKAGMPADHWSSTMRVERYVTQSFG